VTTKARALLALGFKTARRLAEEVLLVLGFSRWLIHRYEARLRTARGGNAETLKRLGWFYERAGELSAAVSFYERVLMTSPNDPTAHLDLAFVFEHLGNPDQAKEHYRSFLEHDVDSDPAFRRFIESHLVAL
jgi:tetratricopeptide (TPR) repeat protein